MTSHLRDGGHDFEHAVEIFSRIHSRLISFCQEGVQGLGVPLLDGFKNFGGKILQANEPVDVPVKVQVFPEMAKLL